VQRLIGIKDRPAMNSLGYRAAGDKSPLISGRQTISSPIYRALLRSRGILCPGEAGRQIHRASS